MYGFWNNFIGSDPVEYGQIQADLVNCMTPKIVMICSTQSV